MQNVLKSEILIKCVQQYLGIKIGTIIRLNKAGSKAKVGNFANLNTNKGITINCI
jgi:hypothetical protein